VYGVCRSIRICIQKASLLLFFLFLCIVLCSKMLLIFSSKHKEGKCLGFFFVICVQYYIMPCLAVSFLYFFFAFNFSCSSSLVSHVLPCSGVYFFLVLFLFRSKSLIYLYTSYIYDSYYISLPSADDKDINFIFIQYHCITSKGM
jgi:hypothetical protein